MKIGVFDSGVGGITVLLELRKRFPAADFVYLGDTANLPYGTKSAKQVERLSLASMAQLQDHGVGALVVACNTASSLAMPVIREAMARIPVLGVVEPGADAAISAVGENTQPILVLATRATVKSGAYRRAIAEAAQPKRPQVLEQECPLLVPMIEEGWLDHPILHGTIQEYVSDHFRKNLPGVALLGCTHYPWIQAAIQLSLPGWTVVNSAQAVAAAFATRLGAGLATQLTHGKRGQMSWIFTDPEAVPAFARKWVDE